MSKPILGEEIFKITSCLFWKKNAGTDICDDITKINEVIDP